ncbi:hypothetical protein THRCLA_05214 [Thraustotheca clavata]|uniref:Uncharacterized protein n=1 Tax=Thraustotheca clavata TaxID=74557 RepID=A0A1V9ZWN3_9STRA|nr:hypothetical protein THRCLA_05214 [Thraustotheca clavata]
MAHELLEMDTFDVMEDKVERIHGYTDAEMMLLVEGDALSQAISQICEAEQQDMTKYDGTLDFLQEWMESELRPAETIESRETSAESVVDKALYEDDDDDDVCIVDIKEEPIALVKKAEFIQGHSSLQPEMEDVDLPAMLDMFSALYSEVAAAQPSIEEPKFSNVQIPAPIIIPQQQPSIMMYHGNRIIAPNSTPNIPHPSYFNSPPPDKPIQLHSANALISPTYPSTLAARTIVKSRTPRALPRLSSSPDIAEQKLNRIFLQYSDPLTKTTQQTQLLDLLKRHRIKEDTPFNLTSLFPPNDITSQPFPLSLFGPNGTTPLTLDDFQNAFQICNRCTEIKRKNMHAMLSSTRTAITQELIDDIAPVIVRVVPTVYEGPKIKSCDHFQWTWCEGFEKTKNEKCNGTNRHDKCPKYLANCTLWKHRLPPKNRKSSKDHDGNDAMDSPAKKLKFFS